MHKMHLNNNNESDFEGTEARLQLRQPSDGRDPYLQLGLPSPGAITQPPMVQHTAELKDFITTH